MLPDLLSVAKLCHTVYSSYLVCYLIGVLLCNCVDNIISVLKYYSTFY